MAQSPFDINLASWNERAGIHLADETGFYEIDAFRAGKSTLHAIEAGEIGDVRAKRLAHLQCHIGLDTLSLARMGADVTGLDFSSSALEGARRLAAETGLPATFVEGNVYDARELLTGQFDIVYVTWGAINWLPDIDRWAKVVASLLAPGGFLYLAESHPFALVFEEVDGRLEPGMNGFFTVDAFLGQRFKGTIHEIRNAAQTVQNVVTYNALIDVANDDLKLRPGMTANTTIIYAEKDDVVAVPNQAIRFRPPPEMTPAATGSAAGAGTGSGRGRGGGNWGGGARPAGSGLPRGEGDGAKTIWVLRDGKPQSITIQTGLTDGTNTELTGGDLHEGDLVIIDANVKGGTATTGSPAGASPAGGAPRMRF